MLAKFSVKKPYTVIVAIVLVILLGVVSLTKMSTDLLPNMNMPYAIVMTTYIGASPEQVESNVTEPIEGAMATASNIKNISSISAENYSVVILEFEQTANMDSITVEMRESLDQITSDWPDTISNPIIMKINPDMLPIMIAAVEMEGKDALALTDYVNDTIIPELESVEGVANVSGSGLVEESVRVVLKQDKIDAINAKITGDLNSKFSEAQGQMDEAKNQIASGKEQLKSGQEEMSQQIGDARNELNNKKIEMFQTEKELQESLQAAKDGKTQLEAGLADLKAQKENITTLQTTYTSLSALEAMKDMVDDATFQLQAGMTKAEFEKTYAQVTASYNSVKESLGLPNDATDEQVNTAYANKVTELETQLTSVKGSIKTIEQALKSVEEGKITIDDALATLNQSEIAGIIEMATASANLSTGENTLNDSQAEFETTKEQAYKDADFNGILTMDTLTGILTAQNFSMPAGYIVNDGKQLLVRVGDAVDSVEALENLVLMDLGIDGVDVIRLGDVAEIEVVNNAADSYAKVNGNPGIMLTMEKQTGYSTGDVSKRIYERIDELKEEHKGLQMAVLMDQGVYIDLIVDSVFSNMIIGAILAVLILIVFLKDIRPTLVIACSIPVSVITAVVLMYFSGVTLNMISLSGLALGIGMLVDNSIVVIENIYRMRKEGLSAKKAAVEGTKQVTGAIVASTLTTVSVFVPIVFTEGITRQLFVDMGLTIAYALLASLVIALTFVPMMSASVLAQEKETKQRLYHKIQDVYGRMMEILLRKKLLVILATVGLLVLSIYASFSKGTAFMPEMESTEMSVTITPEQGMDTEEVYEIADKVTKKIRTIEDVETVGAMSGGGGTMSMMSAGGSDTISLYLILNEDKKQSNHEIAEQIREMTKDIKKATVDVTESNMDMSAMMASGLSIQIKGRDIDKLQTIAKDIAKIVSEVEGTAEVSDGMEETTPELRITVDKEKAAQYGLTVAQVYQKIQVKIADETKDAQISTDLKDYDVYLIGAEAADASAEDIKDMTFTYTDKADGEEKQVALSAIAEFTEQEGVSSITRDAQERYLTVTAMIADGHNVGIVGDAVEKAVNAYELPKGYTIEMTGEDETITEAMEQMVLMMVLGIAFIYLIMVAQFQSLKAPFIILFTIPLALTGGFGALFISNSEVSIMAMIGFVMLIGVIVNNGIVMVDYVNQLRREGMEKREALIDAGKTRMRPIFMTALTTILAMLAMAFSQDMGADMSRPMAIVTIGGLLYGTVMTLIVVPCIYDIFYSNKSMVEEEI